MWCDHPFSQKKQYNRMSSVGGVGGKREGGGGWTKFEEGG